MPSDPFHLIATILEGAGLPADNAHTVITELKKRTSEEGWRKELARQEDEERFKRLVREGAESVALQLDQVITLILRLYEDSPKEGKHNGDSSNAPPNVPFNTDTTEPSEVGRVAITDGAVRFAPLVGVTDEKYRNNGQFMVEVTLALSIGPWDVSLIGVEGIYLTANDRACYLGQPSLSLSGNDVQFLDDFVRLQTPPSLRARQVAHLHYQRQLRPPRPDEAPVDCDLGKLSVHVLVGVGAPAVEVPLPPCQFKYKGGRTWVLLTAP